MPDTLVRGWRAPGPVGYGTVGVALVVLVGMTGWTWQHELASVSSAWWNGHGPHGRRSAPPRDGHVAAHAQEDPWDEYERRMHESFAASARRRPPSRADVVLATLADRSAEPTFAAAVDALAGAFGLTPYTLFADAPPEQAGVRAFVLPPAARGPHLFDLDAMLAPAGGSVAYYDETGEGNRQVIVAIPTRDWLQIMYLIEPRASLGDRAKGLQAHLIDLGGQAAFQVISFGPYHLEAELVTQPRDWDRFADVIAELSPRIVEDVYGSRDSLRETIREENRFMLWWGAF